MAYIVRSGTYYAKFVLGGPTKTNPKVLQTSWVQHANIATKFSTEAAALIAMNQVHDVDGERTIEEV